MACYYFGKVHADMACLSHLHTLAIFVSYTTVTAFFENSALRVSRLESYLCLAAFDRGYMFTQDLSQATSPNFASSSIWQTLPSTRACKSIV